MTVSRVRARKQSVFNSVFEPQIPNTSPLLSHKDLREPFGGHSVSTPAKSTRSTTLSGDQARWNDAWQLVTSRIRLPSSATAEDSFGTLVSESQDGDKAFYSALSLVLESCSIVGQSQSTRSGDILSWHTQQVRQHFATRVMPLLAACASQREHIRVLVGSLDTLKAARRQYLHGLQVILRGFSDGVASAAANSRFQRDLHAIIRNSWTRGLLGALSNVLRGLIIASLCPEQLPRTTSILGIVGVGTADAARRLSELLNSLEDVGLVGEKFQVLFAEVLDSCMSGYIKTKYAGVWDNSITGHKSSAASVSHCMKDLSAWVDNVYGPFVLRVFSRLGAQFRPSDVESWKEIAIGRLATLRIQELFDIVLNWPQSRGGIEDLRSSVTTPQRRLQLTDTFSAALQKRLLHPGSSTLHILRTYISMIKAFHALDHSKVLLARVVHALQLYLCQRDDAIRIVVTGLLSDHKEVDTQASKTKLVELAVLLNDLGQQKLQRNHADDDGTDWNDMTWVPDPVDAGVNYKRPKTEDVIGTLVAALGSQDIFIKEFQAIIAERLLSSQPSFQKEAKVLSLLKKHFSENALQNCDVMMRDIRDSRTLDGTLGRNLKTTADGQGQQVSFHTKILSRLFWPSLPEEPFKIPSSIAAIQEQYEAGFEQLKSSRKLNWIDHLGSAFVQLDLEDRTIEVECKTYEAAVIYAFQDSGEAGQGQRSFNDLWMELQIDEDLLGAALKFWVSQKVIRDVGDQNYVVLERLENDATGSGVVGDGSSIMDEAEMNESNPRKKQGLSAKEQEQRVVYWQFIVGMLTNSSPAMPLANILMMMKMLIADGCSWTNVELQSFLDEKIQKGELELVGGKYRLSKK